MYIYEINCRGFMGTIIVMCNACFVKDLFNQRSLSMQNESKESDIIFATIFVVIWIGAGVVTLNAKLLKGKM